MSEETAKRISEASVKKRIGEGLKSFCIPYRRFGGGPYTATGFPDFIACLPGGQMLMLEVKSPDAKPRKDESAQRKTLNEFASAGALCKTVSSWEEVRVLLRDYFAPDD